MIIKNGYVIIDNKLTKKDVMDYSPIVASKLAMNTATLTAKEIAENLLEILNE